MPGYIREYKSLRIYGNRNKVDTGIHLYKGDIYSVIASGQINLGNTKIGPQSGSFHQYIGKTYLGSLFYIGASSMFEAATSGRLYLGIADSYPDDNRGSFNVLVVVWENENYEKIEAFFKEVIASEKLMYA